MAVGQATEGPGDGSSNTAPHGNEVADKLPTRVDALDDSWYGFADERSQPIRLVTNGRGKRLEEDLDSDLFTGGWTTSQVSRRA
jgi:hypothetical protein